MHPEMSWTPPLQIHPPNSTEEVFIVDTPTKVTGFVVFSALIQFCSLCVLGLMAEGLHDCSLRADCEVEVRGKYSS